MANLISATPLPGLTIRLGFDEAVSVAGVSIAAPDSGMGVISATQAGSTEIDLTLAITPDAPTGEAEASTVPVPSGQATIQGPPTPTGCGATIV